MQSFGKRDDHPEDITSTNSMQRNGTLMGKDN